MKLTKTEKIWLIVVCIFYIAYNLPFVPHYGHAKATILHACLTLIPLWISVYIGLVKVFHIYRLRQNEKNERAKEDSKAC